MLEFFQFFNLKISILEMIASRVTIGKFNILLEISLFYTNPIFLWNFKLSAIQIIRIWSISRCFTPSPLEGVKREDGVSQEVRLSIIENKLDYGGNPCTRRCGCRVFFSPARRWSMSYKWHRRVARWNEPSTPPYSEWMRFGGVARAIRRS